MSDAAFEVLLRPAGGDLVLVGEFRVELSADEVEGAAQVYVDALTVAEGLRSLAEGLSPTREE